MGTIANTEDQDEMPQNALFHRCLHCLLRQSRSSELEIYYILEIVTCDPTMYTIDNSDFTCIYNCINLYGENCLKTDFYVSRPLCYKKLR